MKPTKFLTMNVDAPSAFDLSLIHIFFRFCMMVLGGIIVYMVMQRIKLRQKRLEHELDVYKRQGYTRL